MQVDETGATQGDRVFTATSVEKHESPTHAVAKKGFAKLQNTVTRNWHVPEMSIVDDVDKFRYDVKDNRSLQQVAVARVFRKSGRFIFNLGLVNFFESIIIHLFLVIHCFHREADLLKEAERSNELKDVELPYLRTHVSRLNTD